MKQSSMKSLLVTAIAFGALVMNLSQAFVLQTAQPCRSLSASANSPSWMFQAAKDDSNSDDSNKEPPSNKKNEGGGLFQGISNFFSELDAFIDDATMRKLGQGSKFYGKRKSNFYGEKDKDRKAVRDVNDPTEDYQGPKSASLFKWVRDEESGDWKPVTRMKQKNLERKARGADDGDAEEDD